MSRVGEERRGQEGGPEKSGAGRKVGLILLTNVESAKGNGEWGVNGDSAGPFVAEMWAD